MSEDTLNAALRLMGYSGDEMTAHGFRASFSTLAIENGLWNPDGLERALAHVEKNEVRRAYARAEHWEVRVRLAAWWADFLEERSKGQCRQSDAFARAEVGTKLTFATLCCKVRCAG